MTSNQKEDTGLKDLMTPQLKSELNQFLTGEIPKKVSKPSYLSNMWSNIQKEFFHFDIDQTRKIMRLTTYMKDKENFMQNQDVRKIYSMMNLGFFCTIVACFIIPRKKSIKVFMALGCTAAKTVYFDNITMFRCLSEAANTNILDDRTQEYRNILTFYTKRKLEQQLNHEVRGMLNNLVSEMQANSKDYQQYKKKEHLL